MSLRKGTLADLRTTSSTMTPTNTFAVIHTMESTETIANLQALSPPVTPSIIDLKSPSFTASRQKASGKPSPDSPKQAQVPDVSIYYQVVAESKSWLTKIREVFSDDIEFEKVWKRQGYSFGGIIEVNRATRL